GLLHAFHGVARVAVELEASRHQIVATEPEDDLLVLDVRPLRHELDHVRRHSVDALLTPQARACVLVGPRRHLLDDVEVLVAEVRPHEALGTAARRDLARALQLRQVEPLLRRLSLARVGEERGALHLRRALEEDDRLALAVGEPALVEHQLALSLAPVAVADGHLEMLLAVRPFARRVVECLAAIEDLPRGLPRPDGGRRTPDQEQAQEQAWEHRPGRAHRPPPSSTPLPCRKHRRATHRAAAPGGPPGPCSQSRPRIMYWSPALAVTSPVRRKSVVSATGGTVRGYTSPTRTRATELSCRKVLSFPATEGRTSMACWVIVKSRKYPTTSMMSRDSTITRSQPGTCRMN